MSFAGPDAAWLTPPPRAELSSDGVLTCHSALRTDFWQKTFYGFARDDGHALLSPRTGDFSATLTFDGRYEALYDQAGLMLRSAPDAWIKFGIEHTDGAPHLSVVVTNGTSDWSAQRLPLDGPVTIRATRLGQAVLLQHQDGPEWNMARLAPCPWPAEIGVGPFLCSPEREGFEARFLSFSLTAPEVTQLHGSSE